MRTGVVLPTFRDTPDAAFAAATAAVAAGVDGVFCYDHIWPIGQPERPALAPFPILGALATHARPVAAARGRGPFLGTLVARVGLVPNAVLAAQFLALEGLAPGRVIAGLGTGDRLSEEENRAYGIPFAPAAERRADMVELGRELARAGLPVWMAGRPGRADGGGAGRRCRAQRVGRRARAGGRAAGGTRRRRGDLGRAAARGLASAGRADACAGRGRRHLGVFGWPVDVEELAAAARRLGGAPGPAARDPGRRLLTMEFRRINGLPPYVFATINDLKAAARRAGRDVIDLGFGNPDLPSPDVAVSKLAEAAQQPAQPPLLRLARHPQAAQRHHRPLPAQVRRRRSTPRPRWSPPSGPRRASRT